MTEDLVQRARADFQRAKARAEETAAGVRQAQAIDAGAQAELARMQSVLDWLEQHLPQERIAVPVPGSIPGLPATREPEPAMNLSDRVRMAVEQLGGSAKNEDIREHLLRLGHDYAPLQIRGSAKYLATKGKLVSGGYGIWHLPPPVRSGHHSPDPVAGNAVMNGTR
ncbi:MAG TPA: hypothetical protein VGS62_05770 [Streptosporangiaceae bacterium]|nr:hypothetical protein [Streptosporangiaceae bacterium]